MFSHFGHHEAQNNPPTDNGAIDVMKVTFWHGGLRKDKGECLTNAGFYRPPGIAAPASPHRVVSLQCWCYRFREGFAIGLQLLFSALPLRNHQESDTRCRSGNTTEVSERDLTCCVYWKMSAQGMVSFLSGESGGAIALRMRS